ncbi:tRNA cytosine(34) acetyltransferase TmcA [Marinobacter salinus]|uniref:tRNA(Met) cytidine acetyltransferase TmcA n=1 Tax=Marinobacter salinus TaxID=1874317 RepID=A0A1D9GPZ7_9GAMM|nr:GNAT family N-acetyltransferase [Marinobacter salinus]AOY89669.1 tRNA cytosine(34) acetyltransferase TmcA [Marinobacter salinus]
MTPCGLTAAYLDSWRTFQCKLAQRGERRLVLIEGDRTESLNWLKALLPAIPTEPGVWTGPESDCPDGMLTTLAPKHARQWLGRESSIVVWDGWNGNPPDGFAALAGTLRAGGLLFWLMPPLGQWQRFEDPDYARTGLDQSREHPFAGRLSQILAEDPRVLRINPATNPCPELPAVSAAVTDFAVGATKAQTALVKQLVHFGLGRRRRPLVVTSDRGRGKSAALGMAAAELLQQGRRQVLVTAPAWENVETLFSHARSALGAELLETDSDALETLGGGSLRFLPVRELLARQPDAEVVMVDEAAAVPAPLLKQILLGWPRVVFASTVHGYEGAGRGFAIRFRQVLDRETPQWQSFTLMEPVRWAQEDPLENLVSRLFLLAADGGESDAVCAEPSELIVEPWEPSEASDSELSEAFGLLVDAHYRTTPADLRQWMDDPAAKSWRARMGDKVVGILWGAVEGGLSADIAEQVTLGNRRIRGHMLPQSLATHSGFPEAATQSCLRVVRIAVADGARRLGIGRQLVAVASGYAREQGLDTLGTSYGSNGDLLTFWQSCGLALVRVGLRQEATSGEYPLQMLQGRSASGTDLVNCLRHRLAGHWLTLVPLAWPLLEPRLLAQLTAELPAFCRVNDEDRRDLHSFAYGHRGFLLSLPVLRKLSMTRGVMGWIMQQDQTALWCCAVLQQLSWRELQAKGLCLGQREGEDRLRGLTRQLLKNGPEL